MSQPVLPLRGRSMSRDARPTGGKAAAALVSPLIGWMGWEQHVDCSGPFCSRARRFDVGHLVRRLRGVTVE
jgi:hypothetical protein